MDVGRDRASEASQWASAAVAHVDGTSTGAPLDRSSRITLNFHPDRGADGLLTIETMVRDGVYRSQFETGTSNGGLTAHPGGDRWLWERRLFGGAYDEAPAEERPKYGALNHRRRSLGGAPRFGSAHLRLAEHTLDRATFCFPDSAMAPQHFATAHRFGLLTLADAFDARDRGGLIEPDGGDLLDGYVEAQVHGVVEIGTDVEAIVLDPCYRDTEIEDAATRLQIPVEWHEGRVLSVTDLEEHRSYREPEAVAVGRAIARDQLITARIICDAARTGRHHPQAIKQVWHHTARYGYPYEQYCGSCGIADRPNPRA